MTETAPSQDRDSTSKAVRYGALVLAGTAVAALVIGWAAFLIWLAAETVMGVVHWL